MALFKELGPRDHPQPGDLNPQAEGEFCGAGTQRDLGINPDEILAKMVAHTLGKDRLRSNTYTGVVIRSNMNVTAINPELGPYFKVYKEIEAKEQEKAGDKEKGTLLAIAKAQKALFMMKIRVPILDSMIPDPLLYDVNSELSIKLSEGGALTPEESFSIKCIAMHTTFVGKRGGFFSSNIPPVGTYARVSYENVKNLSGPMYLGEVELEDPQPEGFPANLISAIASFGGRGGGPGGSPSGPGGCNGGLGNSPTIRAVKTRAKSFKKSIFGAIEQKQIEDEIKKNQDAIREVASKEGVATAQDQEAMATCRAKISELKAKLKTLHETPAASSSTDPGERRQDPTLPPSSPGSACSSHPGGGGVNGNSGAAAGGPGTVSGDPGTFSWSDGKAAKRIKFNPTGQELSNGMMEASPGSERTAFLEKDASSGAQLIPPAMEDFKKLAAAYKRKFGKQLFGSGYRTYASQVNVRMRRAAGDVPCQNHPRQKYQNYGTTGEGRGQMGKGYGRNAKQCTFLGFAATPGTSNHGWAAAIDINREKSKWTKGMGGNSPEFRWVNKFAHKFNFVFGVTNEHWHIDWKPFGSNITKIKGNVRTAQRSWTTEGQNDPSITFT